MLSEPLSIHCSLTSTSSFVSKYREEKLVIVNSKVFLEICERSFRTLGVLFDVPGNPVLLGFSCAKSVKKSTQKFWDYITFHRLKLSRLE